jgi:thioredoxin 2
MTSEIVVCPVCGKKNRVPGTAAGIPHCGHCHSPLPWITHADDSDFVEVAQDSTIPVLVDLWAPWCGPCRQVSPALESLARQYAGRIKLVKVDVDQAPATAGRFGVQGIPTLILLQGGTVRARQTGASPEPALRQWLDQGLSALTGHS